MYGLVTTLDSQQTCFVDFLEHPHRYFKNIYDDAAI
jgi:hypothetical protein